MLPPDSVAPFAAHDEGLWQCCRLLDIPPDQHHVTRTMATLPVSLGGLGLSARRTSRAAYWASWADCRQILERQLCSAGREELEEGVDTPALHAAASCADELTGVMGFAPPSWSDLALGARPPPREAEDWEPGAQRRGWQHEASSRVERRHRSVTLFPQLTEALTQSQSGTGAGVALTTTPSNLHTSSRNSSELFCSTVSVFPFLALDASAVAVFLTPLATTVQLAVELECWGDGVSP